MESPDSPAAASLSDLGAEAAVPTKPERPPLDLPMDEKTFGQWKLRIAASKDVAKTKRDEWKAYVRAYMARYLDASPNRHQICVPLEYAYVQFKAAALAFQVPEVHLKPKNPQSAPAVPVFQAALNHELGPENADVKGCLDACLIDVLTCGIAASVIGYMPHLRTRQVPVMQPAPPDPTTGIAPVDPMTGQPAMVQVMQEEQYIAAEEYFWSQLPPEDLLVPVEFVGSNFDRAGFTGRKFELPFDQAAERYGVTEDTVTVFTEPRETLSSDTQPRRDAASSKVVRGYEIWYLSNVYDVASGDLPGQRRKLVILEGFHAGPVEHKPSPYQWMGEDGKLKGMEGSPIHVLTLRFLPGSAYPMSDVEMGLPMSQEISTFRTQMMQRRDREIPFRAYNRERMDKETLEKVQTGQIGDNIGVDGPPNEIFGVIGAPTHTRESFEAGNVTKTDFDQTWAMGNVGVVEPEARTATEVNKASGATEVRLDNERTWVLRWLVKGASKFAALLQRFMDEQRFVEIAGPDGLPALQAWNRESVQGEFVFSARPDSALRLDADVARRQALNLYNQLGKDPNVRRTELLRAVLTTYGMDHSKIVVETPPQEPKPEPPKISLALKGEDLGNPQVLGILAQFGVEIMPEIDPMTGQPVQQAPQPQQQAQPGAPSPPHPGAMPAMEPINKHALRGDPAVPPSVN
jgi:hypothetical protein